MEYKHELECLTKGMTVKKNSHIQKLTPTLQDGVIRVGGRLVRSAMPSEAKHPAILLRHHHVTALIIRHAHETVGHSGRNLTLSRLRQKYWIPKANSAVRNVISNVSTAEEKTGSELNSTCRICLKKDYHRMNHNLPM